MSRVISAARQYMQLGLFMPNCSYGYSISSYKPDPDDWTFDSNLRIARAAEAAGFDFLFPVAKWKGYGGETDYLGTSLETFTWAAALLANTSRIRVFSTVHVPVFHPVATAKMGATLDHIGKGRWGLNIVSGWSEREFGMMGIEVMPHGERYRRTHAYIDILRGLWTEEPGTFNYSCPWYTITDGYVRPQPTAKPCPPIANAGVSEDAKELVARCCDWAFISPPSLAAAPAVVADIKARAQRQGRSVQCACYPFVLWRDTEQEAQVSILAGPIRNLASTCGLNSPAFHCSGSSCSASSMEPLTSAISTVNCLLPHSSQNTVTASLPCWHSKGTGMSLG